MRCCVVDGRIYDSATLRPSWQPQLKGWQVPALRRHYGKRGRPRDKEFAMKSQKSVRAAYPAIVRRPKSKAGRSAKVPFGLVVPSQPGFEQKFITNPMTSAFSSVSTAVSYIDLTALMGAGTDYYNRVGRQITQKWLSVSGTLVGGQSNLATDDPYNVFRITVVKGNVGMTFGTWGLTQVLSPDTILGLDRVLLDRFITLESPGRDSTGYMRAVKRVEFSVRLPDVVTHFTTAAAGSQNGETCYLVMISDSAVVSNPGFVDGSWVLRFTDF